MKSQSIIYLLIGSEYIGFWTLKMKCTQYGVYGQVAFKNANAILFFEIGRSGQQFSIDIWKFYIQFYLILLQMSWDYRAEGPMFANDGVKCQVLE